MFFNMNNAKNTAADASNCAPASSCMTAKQNALHLDTARLAVSIFIFIVLALSLILVSLISLCLTVLLLMVLCLMIWSEKTPESNGRMNPGFAAPAVG